MQRRSDPAFDAAARLHRSGDVEKAIDAYKKILRLRPAHAPCLANLGALERARGNFEAARDYLTRSVRHDPNDGKAWCNLCNLYLTLGQKKEAVAAGRAAVLHAPAVATSHLNLGYALLLQLQFSEAEQVLLEAIRLDENSAHAWNNLGGVYQRQNRLGEAAEAYRRAVRLQPDFALAFSNLLFCMHFRHDWTRDDIFNAHVQWGQRFEGPLLAQAPLVAKRIDVAGRRPRIGLVSADLKAHPVTDFLTPLITHWPHEQFELCMFASVNAPDDMTDWFRQRADQWCDVFGLDDAALARAVAERGIDVLIDLTGHTSGGRMLAMAHRPAPVQMNWLGYFDTLGMRSVDYVLADPVCVPPALEHLFVEKVVRMPHGFVCYAPPAAAIDPGPLPALANGYITFGSQNQLAKVTDEVMALWCQLLSLIPSARLLFQAKAFNDQATIDKYAQLFRAAGVDPARIRFLPASPKTEVLRNYQSVDIALDPFPCAGGTTTCESLWMGVPVVSLMGDRFGCRHSASHLNNVGLGHWVATDTSQYLALAQAYAADLPALARLRSGLRATMLASPLCDGPLFARDFAAMLNTVLAAPLAG